MPVKKSALKALRQADKKTSRNNARKRTVRKLTKTSLAAIEKKEADALKKVQATCKAIDKAVQKGTLHKNTGSRKKSRLMKKLNEALKQ